MRACAFQAVLKHSSMFLRSVFLCSVLLISLQPVKAQADSASLVPQIRAASDSMMAAFKAGDYKTFARFNNETVVNMLGGTEQFASFLEQQMKSMSQLKFTEIRAGRILRITSYQQTWQCIVEQQSEITMEGQTISSISHLVGLSRDGGQSWRFMDGNQGSLEQFKALMPELNPLMPIPRKKQESGKKLAELLQGYEPSYLP